ncbi:hypothetical protein L0337_04330 [candidate division KSB1 bacterium]|nr:hypothetical protein [candidate division KSB1 bacterium]
MDAWDILRGFPTITAAQFYDALSYYYDHKDEIEEFIEANERAYDDLLTEADEVKAENQTVLEKLLL